MQVVADLVQRGKARWEDGNIEDQFVGLFDLAQSEDKWRVHWWDED